MKILKMSRGFFLRWGRSSQIMQDVIFKPDPNRKCFLVSYCPYLRKMTKFCHWKLSPFHVVLMIMVKVYKSDISLNKKSASKIFFSFCFPVLDDRQYTFGSLSKSIFEVFHCRSALTQIIIRIIIRIRVS